MSTAIEILRGSINGSDVDIFTARMEVATSGSISASGAGFICEQARGAGRGRSGYGGSGAGHGGNGGANCDDTFLEYGGRVYGSARLPRDFGSGGGVGSDAVVSQGGGGGGRIRIVATSSVTLNGSILANGQDAPHHHKQPHLVGGGGGSGMCGAVCDEIVGGGSGMCVGDVCGNGWW